MMRDRVLSWVMVAGLVGLVLAYVVVVVAILAGIV